MLRQFSHYFILLGQHIVCLFDAAAAAAAAASAASAATAAAAAAAANCFSKRWKRRRAQMSSDKNFEELEKCLFDPLANGHVSAQHISSS